MAMFDPKQHQQQQQSEGVAAGDYLLVMKSFSRKTGKTSNKPYLRALYKVIHGPAKGSTFFDSLSIDTSNSGAMFRLSMFAEQCQSGAFDLDDNEAIKEALCNKPFKARVSRQRDGEYINNGIQRYLGNEITEYEQRVMDTWAVDYAENGGRESRDDAPPPGDEDAPGGYGYGSDDRKPSSGGGGYGGYGGNRGYDDDIPF